MTSWNFSKRKSINVKEQKQKQLGDYEVENL